MRLLRSFFVILLAMVAFSAMGQAKPGMREHTLGEILSGKMIPLTIPSASGWKDYAAVEMTYGLDPTIAEASANGSRTAILLQQTEEFRGRPGAALRLFSTVFTNGEIILVDGIRNYVTYRLEARDLTLVSDSIVLPKDMRLHLIRVDAVTSMRPLGDLYLPKAQAMTPEATVLPDARLDAESVSKVKQLGLATLMYTSDWDDELPYAQCTASVIAVQYPYMKSLDIARSPKPNSKFVFNMALAGVTLTQIDIPSETPLWIEIVPKAFKSAVAFADGHVALVGDDRRAWLEDKLKLRFKRDGKKPFPKDYMLDQIPRSLGGTKTEEPPPPPSQSGG